jgi:hypothetical protein
VQGWRCRDEVAEVFAKVVVQSRFSREVVLLVLCR